MIYWPGSGCEVTECNEGYEREGATTEAPTKFQAERRLRLRYLWKRAHEGATDLRRASLCARVLEVGRRRFAAR